MPIDVGLVIMSGPIDDERREVNHAAEVSGLFERCQKFPNTEPIATLSGVGRFRSAGSGRGEPIFALQLMFAVAISPAALQHDIEPFFEQRWAAIPVGRVLKYDDIVLTQKFLLRLHVDIEIRIGLIEVMKRDLLDRLRCVSEFDVQVRFLSDGVNEDDQDAGRCGHLKWGAI